MSDSTDLRSLFVDYAAGRISAEQLQALEAALREDSDLRRDLIEYMNIDSALGDMAALSEAELSELDLPRPDNPVRSTDADVSQEVAGFSDLPRQTYRVVAFVVAIAATLLIAAFFQFLNPSEDKQAPVAVLVTDVGSALMRDGQHYNDLELKAGKYRLDQGLVHLQFAGGVMVYVEAPARFDAISDNRVVLHGGRLSANVPPEGIGFTVETPEAEVVDFGTEFSVEVDSGASEVHVFEGLVRVQPRVKKDGTTGEPVHLRTSQAIKVGGMAEEAVEIELATDRFIRNFDEPKRNYARLVKRLSPRAYYRMPIRDRGLVSEPPEYSGIVLIGEGKRPPHARGVFVGGSLRVGADSTGRGGRVDSPPSISTGQFSLSAFVYLESPARNGMVATNWHDGRGNFRLSLDENRVLQATIRNKHGDMNAVAGGAVLPLHAWRHIVVTADAKQLQLYEDGELVAAAPCSALAASDSDTVWFGTDARATQVWDGRIDEVALFDRALTPEEVASLYRTAQEEMAESQ
jgi:hypothetical protein